VYKAVEHLVDVGLLMMMMMMRLWWLLLVTATLLENPLRKYWYCPYPYF